jgi:DHA1 family chloramphenicol resistance protein-like MFS transporter
MVTIDESRVHIPLVVPVLALAIFALGTSEFMIAGLLPELAADLAVSIPQAGFLISAFAIGMIVGAPLMAVLTLRLPWRVTLVGALVVFAVGHVVGAFAQDYAVMVVARVGTAVATGAFWAVAAVVTVTSVPVGARTRALSVLLAGLTVAAVAGVPLGTLVGQAFGWRSAFWAVAALALLGIVGVLATVGERPAGMPAPRLSAEFVAFRRGRLWIALLTTAFYQTSVIATFSYIAPLLTDVTGLAPGWVPAVLFAYGAGGLAGVLIGGRLGDAHPWSTLFGALAAAGVLLAVVALFATVPVVVVGAVLLLGVVAFVAAAPLNGRVFALAGSAPTLTSATNTAAFNVGNTFGPLFGGLLIAAGLGYTAPAWLGVGLAAVAVGLGAVSWAWDRRSPIG